MKNANSFVLSLYLQGIGQYFNPSHRLKSTLIALYYYTQNPKCRQGRQHLGNLDFIWFFEVNMCPLLRIDSSRFSQSDLFQDDLLLIR